jgi:uncharacterized membrane protein
VTRLAALRAARAAVAVLVALLCALFVLWHAQRYSAATAALAGALGVAPWLALAPGLWRGRPRHYVVATLLTTPYLGYGLMEAIANPGARRWAAALVLVAFAVFAVLLAFLRLSRPAAAAPT